MLCVYIEIAIELYQFDKKTSHEIYICGKYHCRYKYWDCHSLFYKHFDDADALPMVSTHINK